MPGTHVEPFITGHRGYRAKFPENTLLGFQKVLEFSKRNPRVRAVELDLRQSTDGEIIVFHDDNLSRLGNSPHEVQSFNYNKLKHALKLPSPYQSEILPKLKDVLDLIQGQLHIYLEIKSPLKNTRDFLLRLRSLLRVTRMLEVVDLICFDPTILVQARDLFKGLPHRLGLHLIQWSDYTTLTRRSGLQPDFLLPEAKLMLQEFNNIPPLPLAPWTINHPELLQAILKGPYSNHLESIITDELELVQYLQ